MLNLNKLGQFSSELGMDSLHKGFYNLVRTHVSPPAGDQLSTSEFLKYILVGAVDGVLSTFKASVEILEATGKGVINVAKGKVNNNSNMVEQGKHQLQGAYALSFWTIPHVFARTIGVPLVMIFSPEQVWTSNNSFEKMYQWVTLANPFYNNNYHEADETGVLVTHGDIAHGESLGFESNPLA